MEPTRFVVTGELVQTTDPGRALITGKWNPGAQRQPSR
jgi:hypothetical protein